jgi:hypothetical protein
MGSVESQPVDLSAPHLASKPSRPANDWYLRIAVISKSRDGMVRIDLFQSTE